MNLDPSNVFSTEVQKTKSFKEFILDNPNISNSELLDEIEILAKNKDDLNYSNRLMFEMYNSNKIVGNSLTRQDTKLILENKVMPSGASYEDFIGCINLNRTVSKFTEIGDLSLDLILDIHNELTKDLLYSGDSGFIRGESVFIAGCSHIPPSGSRVLTLLKDCIHKYNHSRRTLLDVFAFNLEFISIYPFVDGNGRTSRILMNGILEALGYPRLIFKDIDKKFYYKALEVAQAKYSIDTWIRYCLLLTKYTLEYLNSEDILN